MRATQRPLEATTWSARVREWAEAQDVHRYEDTLLLVLTLLIGATVGLVVVAFILVTETFGGRLDLAGGPGWHRLAVPVAGALVSGVLLVWLFPNARGSGIPQTKTALQLQNGYIPFRTIIGKFTCSSMSLATGIALGREGPTVHIGAGIASVLGRRLGLGPRRVQSLIPIGTAAALAAAFNTPISAVLFTLEEILADLHAPVLGSIVLSSATSWAVLHLVLGDEPLFHVPAYQLVHPVELPIYAVLGVVGGLVSVVFVKLLLRLRQGFLALPVRTRWAQPAVGGLVVGALGWVVPGVLGVGYGYVSEALNGQLVLTTMLVYLALKVVATASCYASGNAGGIFGPSLFIGAMLGGGVGTIAHGWLPDVTGSPGAYALVGMGVAFAGIVRAPMTSVIMIFEVTRDYSIIVPLMIANLLSYFISQRLQPVPVYEALLEQDHVRLPAARAHISQSTVEQAMRPAEPIVSPDDRVADVLATLTSQPLDAVPVIQDGHLLGMVSKAALVGAVADGHRTKAVRELLPVAGEDDSPEVFPHVFVDHAPDVALQRMGRSGLRVLPVVSRTNLHELLGIVALDEMPVAYARAEGPLASVSQRRSDTTVRTLLTVVIVGVCGLFLLGAGLARHYYAKRVNTAAEEYAAGETLLQQGRPAEAVERFRTALSQDRRPAYRVALGLSLMASGRGVEAMPYLEEVVRDDPGRGIAHLALARLAVSRGDTSAALEAYRKALAGEWSAAEQPARRDASFELANLLHQSGDTQQALGVLLQLAGRDVDAVTLKRIGHQLLDLGAPDRALEVFQQATRLAPRDGEAHAGVGDAALARGDIRTAQSAFAQAVALAPADVALGKRAAFAARLFAMDPTLPRLTARERWERSRAVLAEAVTLARACSTMTPAGSQAAMLDVAARLLSAPPPRRSWSEAVDALQEQASALWKSVPPECGAEGRDVLASLMAHLES